MNKKYTEKIEIKDLTIDEIIDHCERKLNTESKDSEAYVEYYHVRKYLLELQDIQIDRRFNVGDTVWILQGNKDDGDELDYSGYIFMATCGDYVIVTSEYIRCNGNFQRQLVEMADESYENYGVEVEIFHKRKVFKTVEDVKKAIEIIKGE